MTLAFGMNEERMHPRQHGLLQRRQAESSSTVSSAAATTSVAYPPAPSGTPANINVDTSFDKSYIDTGILPPEGQLTLSDTRGRAGGNQV